MALHSVGAPHHAAPLETHRACPVFSVRRAIDGADAFTHSEYRSHGTSTGASEIAPQSKPESEFAMTYPNPRKLSPIARLVSFAAVGLGLLLAACGGGGSGENEPPPVANSTVASVKIKGSDIALSPGASQTLDAQAYDASGQPVSAALTWRSSDVSTATVTQGAVTAVALGQAQISVSADGVATSGVTVYVNPVGTSDDLLAADLAAGKISADDTLVYEVLALFNDPALPGAYRGTIDQKPRGGSNLLNELMQRFSALSATQKAAVAKYLIPPAYKVNDSAIVAAQGWWKRAQHVVSSDTKEASARPALCSGTFNSGWVSKDSDHFRVWYDASTNPSYASAAAEALAIAETSYKTIVIDADFLAPLDDSTWPCSGGDGRVDIYLLNANMAGFAALTVPIQVRTKPNPAYILVSPSSFSPSRFQEVIAHEFMHVVQDAYKGLNSNSYWWALDASAEWAVDLVYPDNNEEWLFTPHFIEHVDTPLFYPNQYCGAHNTSPTCTASPSSPLKMYGSYLFFEFIAKTMGASYIRDFYALAQTNPDSLAALDAALVTQGGLAATWNRFVIALWNQDPIQEANSFRGWDPGLEWRHCEPPGCTADRNERQFHGQPGLGNHARAYANTTPTQ